MRDTDYARLRGRITVLKEIAEDYPGKTIENVIVQLETRLSEIGNSAAKQ